MSDNTHAVNIESLPQAESGQESSHDKPVKSNKPSEKEIRFDTYSKNHGKPYSAEYFNITDYKEFVNEPRLDFDNMVGKVNTIEEYVLDKMNTKGLKINTQTFDFLMDEILSKIGEIPNEEGRYKLDRIFTYLKNYKEKRALETRLDELKREIYGDD